MEPTHEQMADLIEEWADWQEAHPWIQSKLYLYEVGAEGIDPPIGGCLIGGLEQMRVMHPELARPARTLREVMMAPHGDIFHQAREAVADYLGFDNTEQLPVWNDEDGRTKQEVLDALRGTAKKVRRLADADPGLRE